jgi:biopolymer transport protein ExbD
MKHYGYFDAPKPRIEIIPMIDIMMFLLVFFIMVTLTMIAGSGIPLDLPSAKTAQQLQTTKITIGVDKNGAMYVDGGSIDAASLTQRLQGAQGEGQKLDVVIEGERAVPLQTLLAVMDIVRGVGITAVGIATRPEQQ